MHHVPQTDKWNLIISILELLLLFVFLVVFLSFLFMLCICIRYYSRAQCPRKFRIKLGLGGMTLYMVAMIEILLILSILQCVNKVQDC